jgi:hypothetical protein
MNTGVGRARIGAWYARLDKGEMLEDLALELPIPAERLG